MERKMKMYLGMIYKYMIENRDENIIAVAQTGMGKLKQGFYG